LLYRYQFCVIKYENYNEGNGSVRKADKLGLEPEQHLPLELISTIDLLKELTKRSSIEDNSLREIKFERIAKPPVSTYMSPKDLAAYLGITQKAATQIAKCKRLRRVKGAVLDLNPDGTYERLQVKVDAVIKMYGTFFDAKGSGW